jgi:hypothetical protein
LYALRLGKCGECLSNAQWLAPWCQHFDEKLYGKYYAKIIGKKEVPIGIGIGKLETHIFVLPLMHVYIYYS